MSGGSSDPDAVDPLAWAPMQPFPGRRRVVLRDPVLEPFWSGLRVLAHVDPGDDRARPRVRLIEPGGADVATELPEQVAALAGSVEAADAVIDGVITPQVRLDGVGAAAIPEVRSPRSAMLFGGRPELEVRARGTGAESGLAGPEGFIALDLLVVDGSVLLDVPLLERKRLLESVVREGELVRISVHTRPPLPPWLATWRSLGLRGAVLKAANSRYRPGARSPDWRVVEALDRRER